MGTVKSLSAKIQVNAGALTGKQKLEPCSVCRERMQEKLDLPLCAECRNALQEASLKGTVALVVKAAR